MIVKELIKENDMEDEEPTRYCHRCGMPIFISPVAYKGERDNPHYWHHGCFNMEIRDESLAQSSDTSRTPAGKRWLPKEW